MKKQKRKIPTFKIDFSGSNQEGFEMIINSRDVQQAVLGELVLAISDSILNNKKEAYIFNISGTDCGIALKQNEWKGPLDKALDFFSKEENYDMCIKCRDLIKQL